MSVRIGVDAVRRRIVTATVFLVGSEGIEAVDVDRICAVAETRRAHFETCFGDLEDCVVTVHAELLDQLCARAAAARAGRSTWHDRLWASGLAAIGFLREDPVRARFLISSVNGAGECALRERDRVVAALAELIDAGRDDRGERGAMSRCTADIAAGAVFGMLVAKVDSGALDREEEFLPELIYMAIVPYLGPEAAEAALAVQPLRQAG